MFVRVVETFGNGGKAIADRVRRRRPSPLAIVPTALAVDSALATELGLERLVHVDVSRAGAVNVVMGNASDIGDALLVRKITFTGSTGVGKKLMAGAAGTVKKVSLELGGNAPCIIYVGL